MGAWRPTWVLRDRPWVPGDKPWGQETDLGAQGLSWVLGTNLAAEGSPGAWGPTWVPGDRPWYVGTQMGAQGATWVLGTVPGCWGTHLGTGDIPAA